MRRREPHTYQGRTVAAAAPSRSQSVGRTQSVAPNLQPNSCNSPRLFSGKRHYPQQHSRRVVVHLSSQLRQQLHSAHSFPPIATTARRSRPVPVLLAKLTCKFLQPTCPSAPRNPIAATNNGDNSTAPMQARSRAAQGKSPGAAFRQVWCCKAGAHSAPAQRAPPHRSMLTEHTANPSGLQHSTAAGLSCVGAQGAGAEPAATPAGCSPAATRAARLCSGALPPANRQGRPPAPAAGAGPRALRAGPRAGCQLQGRLPSRSRDNQAGRDIWKAWA
jgi:hypothetical protein